MPTSLRTSCGWLLVFACVACSAPPATSPVESAEPALVATTVEPAQQERDEIFALLAYAVILKDWQPSSRGGRGYNIGSVLVNPDHKVVCWARNSVDVTANESQHGEVRLMTNYLHNTRDFALNGYRLYTTLEPCAMCAGMMTMTEISATIYGQTDPVYGKALQRLEFNSKSIGGYLPYPRPVQAIVSTTDIRQKLDAAFPQGRAITEWLSSEQAKAIYEEASVEFNSFKVSFPENQSVLEAAQSFLAGVPTSYTETPYTVNCSPE